MTDQRVSSVSGGREKMGWLTGIEPATTGTTIRGSTTELQPPSFGNVISDRIAALGATANEAAIIIHLPSL
jgi:hypothetical protein